MPKFQVINVGAEQALATYEGDAMERDGEFIDIVKHPTKQEVEQGRYTNILVATIRLEKGQAVSTVK